MKKIFFVLLFLTGCARVVTPTQQVNNVGVVQFENIGDPSSPIQIYKVTVEGVSYTVSDHYGTGLAVFR